MIFFELEYGEGTTKYGNYTIEVFNDDICSPPWEDIDFLCPIWAPNSVTPEWCFDEISEEVNSKEFEHDLDRYSSIASIKYVLDGADIPYKVLYTQHNIFIVVYRGEFESADPQKYLEQDTAFYEKYFNEGVYGVNVYVEGEEIDYSCTGFYGADHSESGLLEHATNQIQAHQNRMLKKHINQAKKHIKNRVPLMYRNAFKV